MNCFTKKGVLAVLLALATTLTFSQTHVIEWENRVGVEPNGDDLKRVSPSSYGYGGASSVQKLCASTDGYIEMNVTGCDGFFGLSRTGSAPSAHNVDFAIYRNGYDLEIWEFGVKIQTWTPTPSNGTLMLRVERSGTSIVYKFWDDLSIGSPLTYTSTPQNIEDEVLVAEVVIITNGDWLLDPVCNFDGVYCGLPDKGQHDWYSETTNEAPVAISDAIYSEGSVRVSDGSFMVEGTTGTIPTSGAGTRLMWVPEEAAFRAGRVSGAQWDNSNLGYGSFANGDDNIASAPYSLSMGSLNQATGQNGMALGYSNLSTGSYASVMGNASIASGASSFALGNQSETQLDHAFAIGNDVITQGRHAFGLGNEIEANGFSSFTIGSGVNTGGAFMGPKLINPIDNSLMVGFNSDLSTLFVGPSIEGAGKWGQVGIGTSTPEAFLDVKFPYTCGDDHHGLYNAMFDATDGAWDNVIIRNGYYPTGTSPSENSGCGEDGWNKALVVSAVDITTGSSQENVTILTNGFARFASVWVWSDEGFKSNIESIENPIGLLQQLDGKQYDFKFSPNTEGMPSIGFLAQDVQKVVPQLTHLGDDQKLAVNYDGFIPILSEAIKQQQEMIDEKDLEIANMEERMLQMQSDIDELRSLFSAQQGSKEEGPDQGAIVGNSDPIRLYQNQPNPFHLSTTINYYVPEESGDARIFIYDLNGVEISHMDIEEYGNASVTVPAQSLKPGLYLYALTVNGALIDTKRMVVVGSN